MLDRFSGPIISILINFGENHATATWLGGSLMKCTNFPWIIMQREFFQVGDLQQLDSSNVVQRPQ